MFSILIPVYNYDCTELVKELRQSCMNTRIDHEILIGNDGSTNSDVLHALEEMKKLPSCRVIDEEKNIGRAYILNHLAQLSTYPYLIIIDSDARVPDIDFIQNYLRSAIDHDVVCGGITVWPQDRRSDNLLRYRYERAATKIRALEYRKRHPYEKLSTFNLLIRRSVFDQIRFSKRCYQYGYEDTVLGLDLMQQGVDIVHIDNPLVHTGIDSNASFLEKTHKALEVLKGLDSFYQQHIQLSRIAFNLKRKKMLWLVNAWHKIFGPLEQHLLMSHPRVWIFQIYKLGYFSKIIR